MVYQYNGVNHSEFMTVFETPALLIYILRDVSEELKKKCTVYCINSHIFIFAASVDIVTF